MSFIRTLGMKITSLTLVSLLLTPFIVGIPFLLWGAWYFWGVWSFRFAAWGLPDAITI